MTAGEATPAARSTSRKGTMPDAEAFKALIRAAVAANLAKSAR